MPCCATSTRFARPAAVSVAPFASDHAIPAARSADNAAHTQQRFIINNINNILIVRPMLAGLYESPPLHDLSTHAASLGRAGTTKGKGRGKAKKASGRDFELQLGGTVMAPVPTARPHRLSPRAASRPIGVVPAAVFSPPNPQR